MLDIEIDEARNVIMARPEGRLPASDFETLGKTIDDYALKHERMPGLVVFLKGVPHWDGFSALRAHFEVVRKHAPILPRVAVVTDVMGLSFLPGFADIFVRARLRHFDVKDREEAISWAGSPEKEPEGYEVIEGMPENVVAIRALGEVTSRDYEDKLMPMVRQRAERFGKLRLLMQLGPEFERYTAGAIWDDARLGLMHWRSFERVALVSDIGWIVRSAKLFAPLMPAEVAVFPNDGIEAAKAWIVEEKPAAGPATT